MTLYRKYQRLQNSHFYMTSSQVSYRIRNSGIRKIKQIVSLTLVVIGKDRRCDALHLKVDVDVNVNVCVDVDVDVDVDVNVNVYVAVNVETLGKAST